jgi:hypothetical protein
MRIFKLNERLSIVCESQGTRYGFRHLANLFVGENDVDKAKCCYYNRTWERFEFQSVALLLVSKTNKLTDQEKAEFRVLLRA